MPCVDPIILFVCPKDPDHTSCLNLVLFIGLERTCISIDASNLKPEFNTASIFAVVIMLYVVLGVNIQAFLCRHVLINVTLAFHT